jgi:hypothetical protein
MSATQNDHFLTLTKTPSEPVFLTVKSGTIPMHFLGRGLAILCSVRSYPIQHKNSVVKLKGFWRYRRYSYRGILAQHFSHQVLFCSLRNIKLQCRYETVSLIIFYLCVKRVKVHINRHIDLVGMYPLRPLCDGWSGCAGV